MHLIKRYLLNPVLWYGWYLGVGLSSGRWLTFPGYVTAVLASMCTSRIDPADSYPQCPAVLTSVDALSYANRVYAAAGSRFLLPKRVSAIGCVSWVDQIVLITGGKS